MDWKLVASAFAAIFLAELGDKTQLAAITLSASSGRPLSVLLGASVALVSVTVLGVGIGAALADIVPLTYVRKAGAVAFVAIGVAMLADWL
jgi:putative Ca2+/H+ antiporter (TMEM165/GDT1 family)